MMELYEDSQGIRIYENRAAGELAIEEMLDRLKCTESEFIEKIKKEINLTVNGNMFAKDILDSIVISIVNAITPAYSEDSNNIRWFNYLATENMESAGIITNNRLQLFTAGRINILEGINSKDGLKRLVVIIGGHVSDLINMHALIIPASIRPSVITSSDGNNHLFYYALIFNQ